MTIRADDRFGRLVALQRVGSRCHQAVWRCRCDCGTITVVLGGNLKRGSSQSCGCLQQSLARARLKTHGETKTRLYRIWSNIVDRCERPGCPAFKNYGGRGVRVCPEWRGSYEAFADWARTTGYQGGLTIDRINNDGDYTPSNCRWATRREQALNRRSNVLVDLDGVVLPLKVAAERRGLKYKTVHRRLATGWSAAEALEHSAARLA